MKFRRIISAVVASAVAVSTFVTSSSAALNTVTGTHDGATSTNAMFLIDVYNAEKGIDYGIDISKIDIIAFAVSPEDISNFDGSIGGQLGYRFCDEPDENGELVVKSYWGVDDDYLGIDTRVAENQDLFAQTISKGFYMVSTKVDNPLANGEADSIESLTVYVSDYSSCESKINYRFAFLYDEDANLLMAFDSKGTPLHYYDFMVPALIEEIRENLADHEALFNVNFEFPVAPSGDQTDYCMSLLTEAMKHTGVPNEGDYIFNQLNRYGLGDGSGITSSACSYKYDLNFDIGFFTSKEQEAAVDAKVDEVLDSLDLDGKSDYEKICAIYEYICDTTDYDHAAVTNGDLLAHSAYATLCLNKSVCQGYATAIYRLMLEAGIDCRVVVGQSNGEAHAWNIVKLDGKYYYIDSTWDSNFEDLEDYKWFLKGLNDFEDHTDESKHYLNGYVMADTAYTPPAHTHTIVYHEAKAPTCTEIGWDAYETCEECDYTTYVEKPAGHTEVSHSAKAPTCTEIGWDAYVTCEKCDYTTYVEKPATGHTYTDTVVPPTSTEQGYTLHECECGESYKDNYKEPVEFIYGDVNGDGRVTTADVILIRKHMAGGWGVTLNEEAADVNCDGRITTADVILIRKHMAGGWGVTLGPAA